MQRQHGPEPVIRKVRDRVEVIELSLPKPRGRQRVDFEVAERLSQPESPVFYVENSLLSSLFGLLCWEAIFAPIQGAFFHPFQAARADLYTVDFRAKRAPHFSGLPGLLDAGQHEAVIWRLYPGEGGHPHKFRALGADRAVIVEARPALHSGSAPAAVFRTIAR
jgi:hypothetical protein